MQTLLASESSGYKVTESISLTKSRSVLTSMVVTGCDLSLCSSEPVAGARARNRHSNKSSLCKVASQIAYSIPIPPAAMPPASMVIEMAHHLIHYCSVGAQSSVMESLSFSHGTLKNASSEKMMTKLNSFGMFAL